MIRVTLDTGVLPADDLVDASRRFDCEFRIVTVTIREVAGTRYEVFLAPYSTVAETAVWGESRWDEAVWGEGPGTRLEEILKVISSGAFPSDRQNLSKGQLHQLRDAMILDVHLREKHDILISDDRRAFIQHGKRQELTNRFGTRIMLREEFLHECLAGTLGTE